MVNMALSQSMHRKQIVPRTLAAKLQVRQKYAATNSALASHPSVDSFRDAFMLLMSIPAEEILVVFQL